MWMGIQRDLSTPAGAAGEPMSDLTRVEISGTGHTIAVKVGGHLLPVDIATLGLGAGLVPELQVSLPVVDGIVVTLDAKVDVRAETRQARIAMGWTPPAGDGDA